MHFEDDSFSKFFLSHPDAWFNPQKKYDEQILEKYRYLLDYNK